MEEYDYFNESVPDGISNAIDEFDASIECCNQDSYELLVKTFGTGVCGNDLKSATDIHFTKFAQTMKDYFELTYIPTPNNAKQIIQKAIVQWGG